MAVTNLGPCEWFVWDIRRSHLMSAEAVEEAVGAFLKQQPEGEPPALAQYMVQEHLLTPFQAERLLQGKSQDLVLGPYTLLEAVGTGSMGTVYRAISSKDHKPYAVKVLPRRSMWNARMARRQVTAFEKCKHPAESRCKAWSSERADSSQNRRLITSCKLPRAWPSVIKTA